MTEETQAGAATTDTAVAEAPKTKAPRVVAPKLLLKAEGVELVVAKYPMPVKAPRFELSINGAVCVAAQTTFKDYKYTYFVYNGVDFWVVGHIDQNVEYTFEHPADYKFEALKLDRKVQADAAKAAKAAKKAEQASASPESAVEGDESGAATEGSPDASDASTAPDSASAEAPKKGKKASR
jgi:hypothetical protein